MSLNQFPRRAFSGAATLQTFTGNGSTTIFTLSQAQTQNECFVYVDDVAQVPVTDYGINATTLTFTSAPGNGSEIIVRGFGVPAPLNTVSDGAITSAKLATGAIEAKLGYTPASAATVASQLATLVDSAPTTLDTLNELAAALGDDANFATTVTNALAAKASTTYVNDQIAAIQVTPTQVSDKDNTSTGYFKIPVGTTAQRPVSPTIGMVRMNSTTGYPEWYDNLSSIWVQFNQGLPYNIELLIVAGGGGGGIHSGGGGGAGGLLYYGSESPKTPNGLAISVSGNSSYAVVIGAGGAGSGGPYQNVTGNGYAGQNSTFASYTSIGGGGGGSANGSVGGQNGGSGGGGSRSNTQGSGTSGQGFAGGFPNTGGSPNYPGGGGGGASQVGGDGSTGAGGNGGNGLQYSISGTATYYAGGGGGNLQQGGPQGTGGLGGGAAGNQGAGINATGNTGGGGGGAQYDSSGGGAGGSGIVIIRYAGSQRGSGGTVTSSGGYTIHTFTSSGTFTA